MNVGNVSVQCGQTPLHNASFYGQLYLVRHLIEKCGADVNAKNDVSEFDSCILARSMGSF
jgi:hypothetical protein